ncbi:MAG: universal stress protein [Rubrivivax sp.]|nr:universal stress protein [Rubrivivax sp.]
MRGLSFGRCAGTGLRRSTCPSARSTGTDRDNDGSLLLPLARRADELGCDGIVMGTRGMTAIGSVVMGSVATKVVHAANVPVTLVK